MTHNEKTALVTGGAGFIGSHMTDTLTSAGWHVTVLDNLSTGCVTNIERRLEPEVDFVNSDIEDVALMKKIVLGKDAVFHFAAMVSVPLSIEKPDECHRTNVTAVQNILLAMRENPAPFFYASSAAVYGNLSEGSRNERELPIPLSPYGGSKATNEIQARTAWNAWGIPAVGFRFFNGYGPRQNPQGAYASVIPKFCDAMARGKKPVIYGDGEQTRDFIYVKDITKILLQMLPKAKECGGKVFNVATGTSISVNTLLELTAKQFGVAPEADRKPERAGDIKNSRADITLLRNTLGDVTATDIEHGLADTAEWYKKTAQRA